MCGIAGLVHFDGAPVDPAALDRMAEALRHRGPDDGGWESVRGADGSRGALVNRRLSVIDVAGGHQPMSNETADVWAVLNGEIYNFRDLRATLEGRGHRFRTQSDTEVIVHGYEEFGEAVVDHLDGMFALAIWDAARGRLVLARDRFGKKPLVYRSSKHGLAFASELRALRAGVAGEVAIDPEALSEYLAWMAIPAPRTIYRDIRKLPPAHLLVADRQGVVTRPYWSLRFEPKIRVSFTDAVVRVRELVDAAVHRRLMSEVPLGAFLSGGVDSTAVVAAMGRRLEAPVKTFCIGFDDARYDERAAAAEVARALGCDHHELVAGAPPPDLVVTLARQFGEPFADSSAIPSWYLSQLTREHVTVALNGDGGDEVFAGYGRHSAEALAAQWRRVPAGVRAVATHVGDAIGLARASRFARAAALSPAARYRAWAGACAPDLVRQLAPGLPVGDASIEAAFATAGHLGALDAQLAVDTTVYLPTDLLPKVDITSMAHSLEVRSPLLDRALAEYVATLPEGVKHHRGVTKAVLKAALSDAVPRAVTRRPKQGFAVPMAAWLRGPLRECVEDTLRHSSLARVGWLHQPAITGLLDDHLAGGRDHAQPLWVLLMLETWYRACPET